jgi:hypothetical protein
MKSNRITCTTFALFLLLAGVAGIAGAAEPAAAPAPAPVELTALLSDAPTGACVGTAAPAPSADTETDSLAELIRSFTASYGNPEPIQKACVASAGGCQCSGSCSGGGGCFCSAGSCCATCCSQYRAQCC